jgi:hypothetical protein
LTIHIWATKEEVKMADSDNENMNVDSREGFTAAEEAQFEAEAELASEQEVLALELLENAKYNEAAVVMAEVETIDESKLPF